MTAKEIWQQLRGMFLATDKVAHFGVCFVITTLVAAIFNATEWGIMYGAAAAFAIGLAKEIYDMKKHHTVFNVGDLWADCAGIMAACITWGIALI